MRVTQTPSSNRSACALASSVTSATGLVFYNNVGGSKTQAAQAVFKLAPTEAVFNEDSLDLDFRVESDGETHCFFVNGADSKIGINRSAPAATLDVRQLTNNDTDGVVVRPLNETQTCTYSFVGPMATYFMQYVADSANSGSNNYHNFSVGGTGTNNQLLQLHGNGATFNEGGLDRDFRVESDTNTHALFVNGADGTVNVGGTVAGPGAQSGIALSGVATDSNIYIRHARSWRPSV